MSRTAHWMFALLLSAAASAQADEAAAPAELPPRQLDGDGFSCGMQIKFHPNGNDLLGWLGSSLPDLYLKSHPNASQRPSNGRKTPEPCE
ncbi:hypothetical protein [Pseudomonas aeruginosa]|uniref:hypothetical protein n=1 Tax=Pseudomonas aeruginosa TaxID=287 RepID=UPI003CCAFD01